MKIRLRCHDRRAVVDLGPEDGNPPTLQKLRDNVLNSFPGIEEEFELSLNGKEPLVSGLESRLSDLGIVGGDLVIVKTRAVPVSGDTGSAGAGTSSSTSLQSLQSLQRAAEPQASTSTLSSAAMATHSASDVYSSERRDGDEEEENHQQKNTEYVEMEAEDLHDPEAIRDELVNRYLREPIVVAESTQEQVPESLHRIYTSHQPQCSADALLLVLHVLMAEEGFSLKKEKEEKDDDGTNTNVLEGWKLPGARYKLMYQHPASTEVDFVLNATQMGSAVLMVYGNGFSCGKVLVPSQCQMKIKIADFVARLSPEPQHCYHHLAVLSRTYKDQLAHRLLVSEAGPDAQVPCLTTMPHEIQLEILRNLSLVDLLGLSETCLQMQSHCDSAAQWRQRYMRDFGRRSDNNTLSQDWKKLYKEKYRDSRRRTFRLHDSFMQRVHPNRFPPFYGEEHDWRHRLPPGYFDEFPENSNLGPQRFQDMRDLNRGRRDLYSGLPGMPGGGGILPPPRGRGGRGGRRGGGMGGIFPF